MGVAGMAAVGLVETMGHIGIWGHKGLGRSWPSRERRKSVQY